MMLLSRFDPAVAASPTLAVAIATAASYLVVSSASIELSLPADALCWTLIALYARVAASLDFTPSFAWPPAALIREFTRTRAVVLAAALVCISVCEALADVRWVSTIVTPVLVIIPLISRPYPRTAIDLVSSLVTAVAAIFALVGLYPQSRRQTVLDDIVAVPHFVAVAVAFVCVTVPATACPPSPPHSIDTCAKAKVEEPSQFGLFAAALAAVLVGLAGVAVYVDLATLSYPTALLWLALFKTARWAALFGLSHFAPWKIIICIDALTLSWVYQLSADPWDDAVLFYVLAGLASLAQTTVQIPRFPVTSGTGVRDLVRLLFAICIVLPFLAAWIQSDYDLPATVQHPVEELYDLALGYHKDFLARQSTTLAAAEVEYRRRYQHDPPPGFDRWFAHARAIGSAVIDDFDVIEEGLGPLWRLSAADIRVSAEVVAASNSELFRCGFVDGAYRGNCNEYGDGMDRLLSGIGHLLPNVSLLVNPLDEPSVLWSDWSDKELTANNQADEEDLAGNDDHPVWAMEAIGPIWDKIAPACEDRLPQRSRFASPFVETYGVPLVTDVTAERDLCQRYREYMTAHGFLIAPMTLRITRRRVPILSRAAPIPFADVLFPSPHYSSDSEPEVFRDANTSDPWDQMRDGAYWVGRSTGMYVSEPRVWRSALRPRLAAIAASPSLTQFPFLTGSLGSGLGYVSRAVDRWLLHARISDLVQCDPMLCAAQRRALRPRRGGTEDPASGYRFRAALDVDGNGYSGRFYRLLASRSAVLKATVFREWHDDRLVPWLHYLPVSIGLADLPELLRFLGRSARGRDLARRVARQGAEWHARALRPADQALYLYRLFLELAWLADDSRVPLANGLPLSLTV